MNNQEVNTKDLLGIDLGFENCEGMFIPIDFLESLYIKDGEINTYINLSEKIEYRGFYDDLTPLQRIKKMNDITSINLIYKDKDIEYKTIWYGAFGQENRCQTSELISWSKLHLEISKDVLRREIQSMKDQAAELLQQAEELELSIA